MPHAVKLDIGIPHSLRDPGASILLSVHFGAGLYDSHKIRVHSYGVYAFAHGLPETPGNLQLFREQYEPGVRAPPQDGLVLVVPGEDAHGIGKQQPPGREVAPYGQQAVGLRKFRRRKDKFFVEYIYGHGWSGFY